jgi:hypothetical protein
LAVAVENCVALLLVVFIADFVNLFSGADKPEK